MVRAKLISKIPLQVLHSFYSLDGSQFAFRSDIFFSATQSELFVPALSAFEFPPN